MPRGGDRVEADPRICPESGMGDDTGREFSYDGNPGEHMGSPLRGGDRVGADPRVCPEPGMGDVAGREFSYDGNPGEHMGSPLRGGGHVPSWGQSRVFALDVTKEKRATQQPTLREAKVYAADTTTRKPM